MLTLVDVVAWTGGERVPAARQDVGDVDATAGPPRLAGVAIDSRAVAPGDLFVALPGTRTDGHAFVPAAVRAGAAAVLVSAAVGPLDVPAVRVADTARALVLIATAGHVRLVARGTRTVAVTGSAGKTTTKDLTAHVLAGHPRYAGSVAAPPGSFNNEIGLPLTVARAVTAPPAVLVLEMGARGAGHIAELCRIAPPDVSVVLMVGTAHLSEFGSRDAIARAKSEIVTGLRPGGTAVLNADDALVAGMAALAPGRVITFGTAAGDVRALEIGVDNRARASFRLSHAGASAPVRLPMAGDHHVTNALAAAAVAVGEDMAVTDIAELLSAPAPRSPHRMAVTDRPDGVTVIDDAYNASPESAAAALRSLAVIGRGRRTWAVVGAMLELGDEAVAEHDRLGRLAVRLNVSRLLVVGDAARPTHLAARLEGSWGGESQWLPDAEAAAAVLDAELAAGDVVLFKASNAVGLWRLADRVAGAAA